MKELAGLSVRMVLTPATKCKKGALQQDKTSSIATWSQQTISAGQVFYNQLLLMLTTCQQHWVSAQTWSHLQAQCCAHGQHGQC